MTYSEVREMYSMEALDYFEKRERTKEKISYSISLLFSWFLPWIISMIILVLGKGVLNARNLMLSLLILPLSYSLYSLSSKEDGKLKIMFIFFSYLVTLSFLLTVILY